MHRIDICVIGEIQMRIGLIASLALALSFIPPATAQDIMDVDTSSPDLTIADMNAIANEQHTEEDILRIDCPVNPRSCTKYGLIAFQGSPNLAKDDAVGRKYFTFGCSRGDPVGCRFLAIAQLNGRGGASDPVEARATMTSACDGGDAKGCAGLAQMWSKGVGGNADTAKANALYAKACDFGEKAICQKLGRAGK